jgi:hypothetical protein
MNVQQFVKRYNLILRTDSDGTKVIRGKYGHIYEYDEGVLGILIMPRPSRRAYWSHCRKAMASAGATVRQNGDAEGAITFNPANPVLVRLAIKYAGVKPKRRSSKKQLATLFQNAKGAPLQGHFSP